MSRWARRYGRLVAAAAALTLVAAVASETVGAVAGTAAPGSRPGAGLVRAVSPAAQRAARAFWTPARMAAASPEPGDTVAGPAITPPPGIPTARSFGGVPTVGALFFTTGSAAHFCTASVVDSKTQNLVLTAAHCVYSSAPATNLEFVPGYHNGRRPHGSWVVKTIVVAAGWAKSQNRNLDFAFLVVTPPAGVQKQIQQVTGGLQLGVNKPYRRPIEVVGYNNGASRPVECATHSFEFKPGQMEFYCHGFRDGTSGAPWIVRYNSHNGTGVVFGDIGGFELGGVLEWASYSSYFGSAALHLYYLAERQQAR
jgi:Trypsin